MEMQKRRFEAMVDGMHSSYSLEPSSTATVVHVQLGRESARCEYPPPGANYEGMYTAVIINGGRPYVYSFTEEDGYAFCESPGTAGAWTLQPVSEMTHSDMPQVYDTRDKDAQPLQKAREEAADKANKENRRPSGAEILEAAQKSEAEKKNKDHGSKKK